MGILDFLRGPDINQGVKEYAGTPGALLLDVRSPSEYESGFIPGSRNLPLNKLNHVTELAADKDTPIFVYCLSGSRSQRAASYLKRQGYTCVKNIGGFSAWQGERERP